MPMTKEELMAKAVEESGLKADLDAHVTVAVVNMLRDLNREEQANDIVRIAEKLRDLHTRSQ